jgi:acetoacetyl-CoA synthetase
MINQLTPIWERVLRTRPIGAEDRFFDLGGDPASANRLFIEIAKECNRELSPLTIYQAPTIASLAAVLQDPAMPRLPALVQMKAAPGKPAIFMTHGIDADITQLFELIKHIDSPHPIYAMQAKGADGVDRPLESVEEMAQYYFDAIRKVQPHGPYILMGYSFGGLAAFELARRFSEIGEEIALLVLLETYPHARQLSLRERILLGFQTGARHVSILVGLPPGEALAYLCRRSERRSHFSRGRGMSVANLPQTEILMKSATERLRDSKYRAWERYRPQFYGGRIRFVRAELKTYFPKNPAAVWAHLAGKFEMETVPGDHLGIVTANVKTVAAVLSRYLEEMSSGQ